VFLTERMLPFIMMFNHVFRIRAVRKERVWLRKCQNTRELPDLPPLVIEHKSEIKSGYVCHRLLEGRHQSLQADDEEVEIKRTNKLSLHYKRLKCLVDREEVRNLLFSALIASSTDQPEEDLENVLDPECEPDSANQPCYWSSKGSDDAESTESVTFSLRQHVCIVTAIQIRPFRAWFQHGSPIYAPKAVRIHIGGINCQGAEHYDPAEEIPGLSWDVLGSAVQDYALSDLATSWESPSTPATEGSQIINSKKFETFRCLKQWRWISPELYHVAKEDRLQTIEIPPTLCVGGYIRLDLIGRTQRQEVDGLYYTCLGHVTCLGKPLHRLIYGMVNYDNGCGHSECEGDVYCRYWSKAYYEEGEDPIG
jgi:hypothetical protein